MALSQLLKGIDINGATRSILTDIAGRTKISHAQPDNVVGSIDLANEAVAVNLDGFSDAVFFFAPLGNHIITFEQSPDSTNGINGAWYPTLASNQTLPAVAASTATITTIAIAYRISAPSAIWVRARVSTRTTAGAVAVIAAATTAMAPAQVTSTNSGAIVTYPLPLTSAGGSSTPFFATGQSAKFSIKNTAAALCHLNVYNPAGTDTYLQLFNVLLASVTIGTTAPLRSYRVPAGGIIDMDFSVYQRYSVSITAGFWSVPDNTAGSAPATGCMVNADYV